MLPPPRRLRSLAMLFVLAAMLATVSTALAASLAVTSRSLTPFTKTYGATVTCTLGAAADAYVDASSAISNFGTATSLQVRSGPSPQLRRIFIRFDLTACSPAIPAGAIIHSARLRLVTNVAQSNTRTYGVYAATTTWSEGTVTWNTQAAVAGSSTASTTVSSGTASGSTIEWNVISDVQSFVTLDLTNSGWRVWDSNEITTPNTTLTFNSREASSSNPTLVITYVF